jgi:hypothetical protein
VLDQEKEQVERLSRQVDELRTTPHLPGRAVYSDLAELELHDQPRSPCE